MNKAEQMAVALANKFREIEAEGFSLILCLTSNDNGQGKTIVMVDKKEGDRKEQIIVNLLAASANLTRQCLEEIDRMQSK
jgi:hypothetical protein